ncbi:MAG: cadmium-translocating P-type ATPase [Clostridia bacterium]|nr:cadmium-translocating P-type ATPase [Clostridia bacterium]
MTRRQKKNLILIGISALLFLLGILIAHPVLSAVFLFASYLLVGFSVLKEAFEGIIHCQLFDENFLMTVATIGAIVIGEYHEAAAVMLFYQIGEWFQQYAVGKSRESISALMDIRPETAEVERDGQIITVDPEEVEPDEMLVVRAGDRIPLDGIIVEGSSALNTSALTGESLPRDVQPGDEVISGCINQTGLLRIRATKRYEDSTVARILDMVENASDKKAKVESFITRFARIYTPAVCIAAMLLFVIPSLITGGNWSVWGYRALSFLVVSCPCALVISVPLSFFGGIGGASRCGILMKGSNDLEALSKAEIVVFDKTGTLTQGQFSVTEIHPKGITEQEFLALAALVESTSSHPISRSICAAYEGTLEMERLSEVTEIAGMGIKAKLEESIFYAGNAKLMASIGIVPDEAQHIGTVVHLAENDTYLGYLVVADQIKANTADALASIKKSGICRTVMLTGDILSIADAVASSCGIDEVYAQLLPDGKVEQVEYLLKQKSPNGTLVFAGDGINDAPVLTRADVGVAMGALGSDAAVEAADIVLMDDDLRKLSLAIRISRRTMNIVRQNIVFALAVKLGVLLLVALGAAGMWLAVFADVGVSVLAILNAMRALRITK